MKDPTKEPDAVDAVIAAAAAEPKAETHRQITVTIASTGRHVVVSFPIDLTEGELFEFVGWSANQLRVGLAQERSRPAGRLILPNGAIPS